MKDEDEKLSKLLGEWRVHAELPSTFKASVWRRIETNCGSSWGSTLLAFLRQVSKRRGFVASFLLISSLVGGGFGGIHAALDSKKSDIAMAASYLQLLDPSRRNLE